MSRKKKARKRLRTVKKRFVTVATIYEAGLGDAFTQAMQQDLASHTKVLNAMSDDLFATVKAPS